MGSFWHPVTISDTADSMVSNRFMTFEFLVIYW
jgi:hypothetical protein